MATTNFAEVCLDIAFTKIILPCPRTLPQLGMVSPIEYFFFLINPLTYFKLIFHLCWNQVVVCTLNNLPKVSSLPNFISYKTSENGKYRFYKQTSCWSFDQRVMFGSLLHLVSTLPSVVSIHLLQVNICILFVTWPYKTTPVRCYAYLCVTAPRSMSPTWRIWWPKASDSKRKNASPKTWILNMYCHWRIELTGQPLGKKKMSQPQKCTFWEEVPKN